MFPLNKERIIKLFLITLFLIGVIFMMARGVKLTPLSIIPTGSEDVKTIVWGLKQIIIALFITFVLILGLASKGPLRILRKNDQNIIDALDRNNKSLHPKYIQSEYALIKLTEGLSKTTGHRRIKDLMVNGIIIKDKDGNYRLNEHIEKMLNQ